MSQRVPPAPRRLLVVMLRRIGDVLLSMPAIRALRRLFPDSEIDFLVEPPAHQLLQGMPELSRVLVYRKGLFGTPAWLWKIRSRRYDWVIDYMGTPRSAILTWASGAAVKAGPRHVSHRWAYSHPLEQSGSPFYSAREKIRVLRSLGLGPDENDFRLSLTTDADSEDFALDALNRMRVPQGALVGIAPASRRETRRWPAASYAALGRLLRDRLGASLLVFWGPGEKALAREIRDGIGEGAFLAPETESLRSLASLIGRCRLLITNCNGPKHIAVARDIPTLTVHGSSDPTLWNPPGNPRHPFVRLESLDCIGCQRNKCPYALECLRELKPEEVYTAAERLLKAQPAAPKTSEAALPRDTGRGASSTAPPPEGRGGAGNARSAATGGEA